MSSSFKKVIHSKNTKRLLRARDYSRNWEYGNEQNQEGPCPHAAYIRREEVHKMS